MNKKITKYVLDKKPDLLQGVVIDGDSYEIIKSKPIQKYQAYYNGKRTIEFYAPVNPRYHLQIVYFDKYNCQCMDEYRYIDPPKQ